jgi:hypothetical protein
MSMQGDSEEQCGKKGLRDRRVQGCSEEQGGKKRLRDRRVQGDRKGQRTGPLTEVCCRMVMDAQYLAGYVLKVG